MGTDGSGVITPRRLRAAPPTPLPRNDPAQYDELAGEWWRPDGAFAMLHWLAEARAELIPVASRPGAVLVDVGCGAGLLAPHLRAKGYRHVGMDLVRSALAQAAEHGVGPVNADATALPLPDGCADVVVAGELLEHVPGWPVAVAEVCRVLRPGGTLVLDTLNDTVLSRLIAVDVAERLRGVPRGIHDPQLFVDSEALVAECARHGVRLTVRGVRPAVWPMLRWLVRQATGRTRDVPAGHAVKGADLAGHVAGAGDPAGPVPTVDGGTGRAAPGGRQGRGRPRIVPTWSSAVLYQGHGVKEDRARGDEEG